MDFIKIRNLDDVNNISGIYYLINNINLKKYVGQAINIRKRIKEHIYYLRNNDLKENPHIRKSWLKYGENNFSFYFMEFPAVELNDRETYYITLWNTTNPENGYNKTEGGLVGKILEEVKSRMRLSKLGKKLSNEHKAKLSEIMYRRNLVGDRNPMKKGHSEESKIKISNSMRGENHPFYGKKFSDETKNKISKSKTGIKLKSSSSIYHGVSVKTQNGRSYWRTNVYYQKKLLFDKLFQSELDSAIAYDKYIINNNIPKPINFNAVFHLINFKFVFMILHLIKRILYEKF